MWVDRRIMFEWKRFFLERQRARDRGRVNQKLDGAFSLKCKRKLSFECICLCKFGINFTNSAMFCCVYGMAKIRT